MIEQMQPYHRAGCSFDHRIETRSLLAPFVIRIQYYCLNSWTENDIEKWDQIRTGLRIVNRSSLEVFGVGDSSQRFFNGLSSILSTIQFERKSGKGWKSIQFTGVAETSNTMSQEGNVVWRVANIDIMFWHGMSCHATPGQWTPSLKRQAICWGKVQTIC